MPDDETPPAHEAWMTGDAEPPESLATYVTETLGVRRRTADASERTAASLDRIEQMLRSMLADQRKQRRTGSGTVKS